MDDLFLQFNEVMSELGTFPEGARLTAKEVRDLLTKIDTSITPRTRKIPRAAVRSLVEQLKPKPASAGATKGKIVLIKKNPPKVEPASQVEDSDLPVEEVSPATPQNIVEPSAAPHVSPPSPSTPTENTIAPGVLPGQPIPPPSSVRASMQSASTGGADAPIGKPVITTFVPKAMTTAQRRPGGQGRHSMSNRRGSTSTPRPRTLEKKIIEPAGEVEIPPRIRVSDFAQLLKREVTSVISTLIQNGIFATINEEIDYETAAIIAQDMGFETKLAVVLAPQAAMRERLRGLIATGETSGLLARPPVVTIMGHVDHGKTSLLDAIRQTEVAKGEAGGITQHIGAYQVHNKGKLITFLDTPGHEAFNSMRQRGANVTDIAILVVAANDGVKPQTKEAIRFIKEANVPMIVAINKIDLPDANPNKTRQELAEAGVLTEGWGGDVVAVEVSAKTQQGLSDLEDMILLVAEVAQLQADPRREAIGVVVESDISPADGPVATVLIKTGTLHVGDNIVIGSTYGRVKVMRDGFGKPVEIAPPSTPVRVIGLNAVPQAGDILETAASKTLAKKQAERTAIAEKAARTKTGADLHVSEQTNAQEFNILVKADVQGSLEAIIGILSTFKSDEVKVNIISTGVGSINESDIMIAAPFRAQLIGFNVEATTSAQKLAERDGLAIHRFTVIYELVEMVRTGLSKLLKPEKVRRILGKAKMLKLFKRSKDVQILGGRILSGRLSRSDRLSVVRDGEILGDAKIDQLQSNKEIVNEVKEGMEFGLALKSPVAVQESDFIEAYMEEEVFRTFSVPKDVVPSVNPTTHDAQS